MKVEFETEIFGCMVTGWFVVVGDEIQDLHIVSGGKPWAANELLDDRKIKNALWTAYDDHIANKTF